MTSLLVFRALAGIFGSSPLANAGGTIADMFDSRQRGLAMAIFGMAFHLYEEFATKTLTLFS